MARHKWEKSSNVISYCKVCGCRKNTRMLTPEYTMPGHASQYGKAPECPGNKLDKSKEVPKEPDPTDKLNKLFAEADQVCANLKDISDKMKGRKICSQCGIDYDINQKHTCD